MDIVTGEMARSPEPWEEGVDRVTGSQLFSLSHSKVQVSGGGPCLTDQLPGSADTDTSFQNVFF